MATQLYAYSIAPGDRDHLPAYAFTEGIVEAEPDEVATIVAELEDHFGLLDIRPIDTAKVGVERLRVDIGAGLSLLHSEEVEGTPPCDVDAPYIEAYESGTGWEPAEED